jgi:hypothetical protein
MEYWELKGRKGVPGPKITDLWTEHPRNPEPVTRNQVFPALHYSITPVLLIVGLRDPRNRHYQMEREVRRAERLEAMYSTEATARR